MATLEEMVKWDYKTTWSFFSENTSGKKVTPEAKLYLKSLTICPTEDIRDDFRAREKILEAVKEKTLILIDGASLNGKSTFARRLAKMTGANVVDIDILCKICLEKEYSKITNPLQQYAFLRNMDKLTDEYIFENLERIIKEKSQKGSVILVGCYMAVVYRAIIVRTLGKYFSKTVSLYCCSRSFEEVKMLKAKRDKEFGFVAENDEKVLNQYLFSKELLENDGILLGIGMAASFVMDINVSDMFV